MSQGFKWTLLVLGIVAVSLSFGPYLALPTGVFITLVVGMVVGAMKLYRRWSGTAATPGISALIFGLVANGIVVGLTMLSFLLSSTGSSGRPMGLAAFYFMFALIMTPLGIWKAVRARAQEESLAISAMILSLGILPIALLTFVAMVAAKAFELEP
jgi:hypothetical protein